MWITSLGSVRKSNFELFYYTHHLYILFVICLALHVSDHILSVAVGSLLLFALDRYLRFIQAQKRVGVLSANLLPCGTLELVLAKPPSMNQVHLWSTALLPVAKVRGMTVTAN